MQRYDVIVLTPYEVSSALVTRVRAFVESGGGLLVAATGWGWQSGSKKPMSVFPGNQLLAGSGVAWTDGFAGTTTPGSYTTGGEISPFINAAFTIKHIQAGRDASPQELRCGLESIRLAIGSQPGSESQFRTDANRLLDGLRGLDLVPTRQKPVRVADSLRRFAVGLETVIAADTPPAELRHWRRHVTFPAQCLPRPRRSSTRWRSIPPFPAGTDLGSTLRPVR